MRAFEPERVASAGKRFIERTAFRVAPPPAPADSAPASSTERRKRWLARNLTRDRARAAAFEADAHGIPRRPAETVRSFALERIIGSPDLLDINYLELAIAVGRAVCRIRLSDGAATGFLVGPQILMTNNHVIDSEPAARAAVAQFDYQDNEAGELLPAQTFTLSPRLFFVTDATLDFTLVGVAPTSSQGRPLTGYPWLPLIGQLGKADLGDPVNIIQHPRGGLKQIALRNNQIIDIPEGKRDFLYYTTDTEPGSSGSPCFNDQWELIALHHSGVPRMRNDQILKKDETPWREGTDDPALIDWIANEGARVSAIVDATRVAALPASQQALRDRMLSETAPNPVEVARAQADFAATIGGAEPAGGARSASMTVPLTITVSLGDAAAPAIAIATAARPVAAEPVAAGDVRITEAVVIDPDWAGRKGYDPHFLGVEVPLPVLSAAMRAKTVEVPPQFRKGSDKYTLHYHHYSLAMHKTRRFAWYSAAIIDGDHRFTLPDRDDKWFIDQRIDPTVPPKFQCGEELYATASTDRGHLTRYLDVAWGATRAEAITATNDTFHFTNCCLQLSGFNQGKSRWQGLEIYLLENKARKEKRRMAVMTGPVLGKHDPVYRNPHMSYSIPVPLAFWKVCALERADGTLSVTGFVLGQQDITTLPGFEEKFDVTAAQVTLADLEHRTGLGFGGLKPHDHFAAGGAPGTLEVDRPEGRQKIRPLSAFEDIVV
jgi:endonuclease G